MKQIVNVSTGKVITRELSEDEIKSLELIVNENTIINESIEADLQAKELLKSSAKLKLAALGLTDEEISAIIG